MNGNYIIKVQQVNASVPNTIIPIETKYLLKKLWGNSSMIFSKEEKQKTIKKTKTLTFYICFTPVSPA